MEDILIIGAGIFGLSLARKLLKAGRGVMVAESHQVGAGASATPLGVLAPHAPDNWNPKKEAQFQALTSLPDWLDALEQETGCDTGYQRRGRLIPLTTRNQYDAWMRRLPAAAENWRGTAALEYIATPDPDWIAPDIAGFGAINCGLTASIDARKVLRALAASLGTDRLRTGLTLERVENGAAQFADGERIAARQIILATGAAAFAHLPDTPEGDPAGRGEKGQAALLDVGKDVSDRSLIYHDGTYVVPRGGSIVAVGATSERHYEHPTAIDALLEGKIASAKALCPAITEAKLVESWAALRPRAHDRAVTLAPHPHEPNVTIATGGFKTGLAMAHTLDVTRFL